MRLSRRQPRETTERKNERALHLLYTAEMSCGGPDSGYAWASSDPGITPHHGEREVTPGWGPWMQVEVHYRTVARLLALGLVEVESYDARWDHVALTDAGRDLARRYFADPVVGRTP